MSSINADHYFLRGGGEMGELIRATDWRNTPLGDPAGWPQSLCTMVAVMLDNPFGMYIAWGREYTQLYNDGYRPILGKSKHPQALGNSTRETFAEIWHIIESMFDGVMEGKAVGFPDFMLPLQRNGYEEDCYFDFSYSPIRTDNGEVGGVLVTVIETTEKKRITEALKESKARFINNIMQAPVAMCIFRGPQHIVEIANEKMLALWGKLPEAVMNKPIFEGLPEAKDQGLEALMDLVYSTGENFEANERGVKLPRNGKVETTYVNFVYQALKEADGSISGIVATATEVTPQVVSRSKVEESEQKVRAIVENAPFPIAVYVGKEMIIELANQSIVDIWGKGNTVIGQSFRKVMPELAHQQVFEQIEQVLATGNAFHTKNTPINLEAGGKLQTFYFNYSLTPLYDVAGNIYGVMNTGVDITELYSAKKQIEESKQLYETIAQNTPDLIYVFDLDYRFSYANEALLNMWGRSWEDAIGKGMLELGYQKWHAEMHEREIDQVIATKSTIRGKVSFKHAILGTRIYDYIFAPIMDAQGQVKSIAGTTRDITQLAEATKQIEENEQNIRSMVLQSPIGICVIDAATMVSEIVNDSFVEIAGKPYSEIAGKHYWETFAEARDLYELALNKVIEDGKSFAANEVELMLIRNGKEETRYVTFVYAPLKNIEGIVKQVAVWVLDNTTQVITRRKIEEADIRFRNTVKQAPVGISILRGPEYIVEMANDAYLELVDRKESELIGQPLFDVLPEVKASVHALLDSVLYTGVPYHGNEVAIPVDRQGKQGIYYFDFLYYPLKELDGNISGIIVTVTEVSEQVEARKKTEQNEERLNIVVEASELGTWELNLKTMTPHYSRRYLEIIGGYKDVVSLTHEELIRHLHPDDLPIRDKAFKEAMETGNLQYESRLIWTDQSIHWMEGKGKVFYDSENHPEKMIGTLRDITAEKNHQAALEESEERFRNLIMQSPVAKAILSGEEHIVEIANDALLQDIWRTEPEAVIGKKILDIFPELKKQKFAGLLDTVYTTGIKHAEKESLLTVNGNNGLRQYYVDFEYAPVFSGDGNVTGIKITVIDVTEKVEARKQIEDSEKRFRSLAESLPQLVWETDEKGNALFASGRWEEYSGIRPSGEAEWMAIIHPDDVAENTRSWMHSLATGDLYRSDVRLKSKSGEYRWHSVIGEPVYNSDQKIIKWVGAFTDTQTEKSFTRELEKQVTARTKELGNTNIELEKKNKELQTFAYISSHDLQEPLRKIQTFATQLLEKEADNLSDKGKDSFRRMVNSASRMQTLIDDLLIFSRTNIPERRFEWADLSAMVEEVKDDVKEELQKKQGVIETSGLGQALIIPVQFRQLLLNLVNNSLKFSKPGLAPHITITGDKVCIHETMYHHIRVSDNGIGFEQQYSEKIFEVFQRLHGKSDYNGTGIGLSIVKRIIENHHGFITATGELNKGATFHIYIPSEG